MTWARRLGISAGVVVCLALAAGVLLLVASRAGLWWFGDSKPDNDPVIVLGQGRHPWVSGHLVVWEGALLGHRGGTWGLTFAGAHAGFVVEDCLQEIWDQYQQEPNMSTSVLTTNAILHELAHTLQIRNHLDQQDNQVVHSIMHTRIVSDYEAGAPCMGTDSNLPWRESEGVPRKMRKILGWPIEKGDSCWSGYPNYPSCQPDAQSGGAGVTLGQGRGSTLRNGRTR
mgnify:CR=1 FL=1